MNTEYNYLLTNNLFNNKSHDLANIYFPKYFKKYIMNPKEIIAFISNNNKENYKIFIYSQGGPSNHFYYPIIKYLDIQGEKIKAEIVVFSFDWWFHPFKSQKINNDCLKLMFKPKNYKLVAFTNLDIISNFHNISYKKYEKNIITNNIWCCYNSSFINFNENPLKILAISGEIKNEEHYPERKKLTNFKQTCIIKKNTAKHENNNYYNLSLNKYIACFASSVYVYNCSTKNYQNTHCILLKTFEILASGSLLVVPLIESKYLEEDLGIKEGIHFLSIDFKKNIQIQIDNILCNPNINTIRKIGQDYAKENLTSKNKFEEISSILNIN